jgi:hypothetical protein
MRALSMSNARILVVDDEPQIQRFLKTALEVNGYEVALASGGRAGLAAPIGRPPSGPLGSVLLELREAMLQLHRTHPGWGADTILAELCPAPRWTEHPLPSRARIAALVGHAKLTRRSNRHTKLPEHLRRQQREHRTMHGNGMRQARWWSRILERSAWSTSLTRPAA